MQPYFFPYWGHFSLIAATECWVVFDVSQYTPKSWMTRNRVLHPTRGWQYLSVPLSNGSQSVRIHQALVKDRAGTRDAMVRKLEHYRRRAPYFDDTLQVLCQAFDDVRDDSLVELDVSTLRTVCRYLDIRFEYRICSQLPIGLPDQMRPGEWAPRIAKHLGAAHYINPESGRELFDRRLFEDAGIKLSFLSPAIFEYPTRGYTFEANLSILDAMMWNEPAVIRDAVSSRYILST
ncbi:MAG: WbqC family protein [Chromatiaceae bacterium]|nr:WbqC family protein [Chromatiaceae bacterium]MCP5422284.1 WbqC family protein [Chromatiaceae bacterium]